jgi:hypothetical protein
VIAAEQDRQRPASQRIMDSVADGLTPDRRFLEVPVAVDRRRVRIDWACDAAIFDRASGGDVWRGACSMCTRGEPIEIELCKLS